VNLQATFPVGERKLMYGVNLDGTAITAGAGEADGDGNALAVAGVPGGLPVTAVSGEAGVETAAPRVGALLPLQAVSTHTATSRVAVRTRRMPRE
jgi:hypothetical protein